MQPVPDAELQGIELWRRQCARNLMDCYALGMQALMKNPGHRNLETLTRLMVDGMTVVREAEDEQVFYRTAASLCRQGAEAGGEEAALFRIYAAIFEDMGAENGGGRT
jgi:hypothetical protein